VNSEKKAYFISDAHLGVKLSLCDEREEHLLKFLKNIHSSAEYLFILGDLFDFWIEYRNAIRPVYFPVLHELKNLAEAGVKIHYMAGNHDFALGNFLTDKIGICIHDNSLQIELQGKRLFLQHGDGVAPSDFGYRILRRVLRNPVNLRLYKLIHPDLGVRLAELFSGSSRQYFRRRFTGRMRAQYLAAAQKILEQGNDIVMFGHTHTPEVHVSPKGIYCNIGEWLRKYYYVTLKDGVLERWEYIPGSNPRLLS
jgi:UDP-2,3-diacylglucosamine hydrolase